MSKVRTFSRVFPSHHPMKGEETFFVEKLVLSWVQLELISLSQGAGICNRVNSNLIKSVKDITSADFKPKLHTIRAGQHFKPGDKFSPRVWSGKPYGSKQIIIGPDIEVKKTFAFCKDEDSNDFYLGGELLLVDDVAKIACNDGLTANDFRFWFNKPFDGQVICWDENLNC